MTHIKTFKEYINEKNNDNNELETEIKNSLETEFYKIFPNGNFISSRPTLGSDALYVHISAVNMNSNDFKKELNGIPQNDPIRTMFMIDFTNPDNITLESDGTRIAVKPEEGSYMAMSKVKVPFRKSRSKDVKTLTKKWNTYLTKVKKAVQENMDNIYGIERYQDANKWFK